jgi:hypothetical protein
VIISATGSALCCANVAGAPVTDENPAVPGETLIVYATGLGLPDPTDEVRTGEVYTGGANKPREFVSSLAGGKTANVLYAGLQPGTVGVWEVHLELNSDLPTDPVTQATIAQDVFVSNIFTFPLVNPNPVTTTPVLDLQASTRVRDYDITLNLNGQIDRPNVTYRSEPPLPTSDIIGLLAFGQTSEESAQLNQSQSAFNSETSSAILSAALNATVSNRVQKLFGVSRIKIDPQGLNTETSSTQTGPAVTIEQQVKNNLTLTYTTNVAQASQQIIQAEYNITRNVSIVGVRDQNGVVSIDVRIRQRKK